MRKVSAMPAPRSHAEGFLVGRRRSLGLAAVTAALVAGLVAPARAANVTVLVSVVYTGSAVAEQASGALCPVTVAENANAVTVLSVAQTAGCITSYATTGAPSDPFGRLLNCISGVCGGANPANVLYWFWGIHLNLAPTPYGVDGYKAKNQDHLMFLYQPFPCPPYPC